MWHIFVSDVRKGKTILHSDCSPKEDIQHLNGTFHNGAETYGIISTLLNDNDLLDYFYNKYGQITKEVFYIDVIHKSAAEIAKEKGWFN